MFNQWFSACSTIYLTLQNDFVKDKDHCIDNGCVNGQCKDGINSYTCDCNGTGYNGKLCENGEVYIICLVYICEDSNSYWIQTFKCHDK